MATVIEHDVHHEDSASSALTAFVAIVGILLVVGVALYTLGVYPFSAGSSADPATTPTVNVTINDPVPAAGSSSRP